MTWGKLEYQKERLEENVRMRQILHDITVKYTKLEEKTSCIGWKERQINSFQQKKLYSFGIADKIL